jgi:hypothetical protein
MNPLYKSGEDAEFDEEVERNLNRWGVKLGVAILMDSLGLVLMFVVCDMQFKWMMSLFVDWNPFDYVIQESYPLRSIYGGGLYFLLICCAHIVGGIYSHIKFSDRFDKHMARVVRTYY